MLRDPVTGNPSIPFTLYAMECEGDLDTKQSRYNQMIKDLRERASWSPIDETDVIQATYAAGLLDEPTPEEIEQIMSEVLGNRDSN